MPVTKETRASLKGLRRRAVEDFIFFRVKVLGREHVLGNRFQEEMASFFADTGENAKPIKLIRVPRGHGKTTDVIDDVIWKISKDRNRRILISGPTREHAKGILHAIQNMVEKNRMLRELFPDVWPANPDNDCPWWSRDRIEVPRDIVNKNPTVQTSGVDSGTAGSHYTDIYLDDQVNDDNYKSKMMRDSVWNHTLHCHALLDDTPGQRAFMTYTNTPWHPQDATMLLTSMECSFKDDVDVFERSVYLSGGEDATEGVIWPEVRSEEFIRKQRAKGMRFFSPHYLMKPLAEGQHPFDVSKIERFVLDYDVNEEGVARWTHPLDKEFFVHLAVDTNTNADTAADPAALMVWAKDEDGHMWGLDKKRLRGPTTPQLLQAIHDLWAKWRPVQTHVELRGKEDRFYYELMQSAMRKGVCYGVNKVTRGGRTSRSSKFSRIVPMAAVVAEGWFHVPDGDSWRDFIEEMDVFDESCEHDDMMDATADVYAYGRRPIGKPEAPEIQTPQSAELMRVWVGPKKKGEDFGSLLVPYDAGILV